MGPKRADNTSKSHRLSHIGLSTTEDQETQHCIGKFAADLELCCRESSSAYPIHIPVYIRGHPPLPPSSSQIPGVSQQQGTYSGASVSLSVVGGEEQILSSVKRPSGGRIPSLNHSGTITGIDNDTKSSSILGHESLKSSSSSYKTFHVVRNSDFYRPKFFVDSIGHENESIDQIKALYMRAWQLDQRFIDIFKKILPLQEQLHTLNFGFVGLNEKTLHGLAEVCQLIPNLKTVSLDGNPLAAEHFYTLIEKVDSKITHLSLRFCKITDTAAERLANALGNISTQNRKLLTLILTGNQIGDNGAKSFAKGLRYNRTLISLNLSLNFITDKGACAIASVLRKFVLTQEEIIRRRYLLSEHYGDTHGYELRNYAPSPTLSTKSRSARDSKRILEPSKRYKSTSIKTTDKRHGVESSEENHPPSPSKGDHKKGKHDGTTGRSASVHLHSSSTDQLRPSTNARGKKSASGVNSSSKKSIPAVKDDEDIIEKGRPSLISPSGKLTTLPMPRIDHENPLLEKNANRSLNGEICSKGNLVLLNLNLSRNYLTLNAVNEFLLSIQYQTTLTNFNNTTLASLIEFSGLCRLELKGMNDIPIKSSIYQSLEALLLQKNPSVRFQQIKEHEAKEFLDQQSIQVIPEKTRIASSIKPTSQRPTTRLRD